MDALHSVDGGNGAREMTCHERVAVGPVNQNNSWQAWFTNTVFRRRHRTAGELYFYYFCAQTLAEARRKHAQQNQQQP